MDAKGHETAEVEGDVNPVAGCAVKWHNGDAARWL